MKTLPAYLLRICMCVARAPWVIARSRAGRLPPRGCQVVPASRCGAESRPRLRGAAAALQYKKMYTESIEQPEAFWGKMAEEFHWEEKVRPLWPRALPFAARQSRRAKAHSGRA